MINIGRDFNVAMNNTMHNIAAACGCDTVVIVLGDSEAQQIAIHVNVPIEAATELLTTLLQELKNGEATQACIDKEGNLAPKAANSNGRKLN